MIRRPAKWDILSTRRRENTNGLLYWGTFQDGTAMDWSGNQNNGQMVASPAVVPGFNGNALNFNGSTQSITLPTSIHPAACSVVAWVNAGAFTNALNSVYARNNNSHYFTLTINSSGKLALYLVAGGSQVAYNGTGAYTLATGKWYRTAMCYDSVVGLNGYVNGALDATVGANGTIDTSAVATSIGIDPANAGRQFSGAIGDVCVYNRALTGSEVNTDYNQAVAAANQPEGELPMLFYPIGGATFNPAWAMNANWLNGMRAGT